MDEEPLASEAIYSFVAWLTTREESITMGSGHDCVPAVEAIKEFCKVNHFNEPRMGWQKNIKFPKK